MYIFLISRNLYGIFPVVSGRVLPSPVLYIIPEVSFCWTNQLLPWASRKVTVP